MTTPSGALGGGAFEPEYPIRTERLLLRAYAPGDVDAVYAYERLPQTARFLGNEPMSRAEAEALVTRRIGSSTLAGVGEVLNLVIELARTGVLVGDCVLFWRSQGQAEVGYVLNPAHHGRGYATEAVEALLRLGFEDLRLHRVAARCDARNTASARVMERAGLHREAHLVQSQFIKGEWTDELIYAILRSEWAARQPPGQGHPPGGAPVPAVSHRSFLPPAGAADAGLACRTGTLAVRRPGREGMFELEYPIRTERLVLRPFAPGDVDGLYAYHRLPEVHRYLYSEARSRAEVEALVADRAGKAALTEAGEELHLVADLADTGELAGDCVLFWRSEQHQKGEIGYTFNPAYHGRGLATEAAVALLRLGFEGLGLHRITGHLDARNIASARVLERAGMRLEAHLVENEFVKGEWSDELVYAMLRSEWETRQARG